MKHSTSPKDVFLQLFATAMLYLSIIGTFVTTFSLISFHLRTDDTSGYPNTVADLGSMLSFPLAMLIVSFPLFVWVSRKVHKRMESSKALKESRARIWLSNLTLFLAGIIITVTAMSVVYTFLDGALTMSTLLKSIVVLLVSGLTILWYKGGEDETTIETREKIVAIVSMVLFVAILISAMLSIGSPKERRDMRTDQNTRNDLEQVYYEIEANVYDYNGNRGEGEPVAFPEELERVETGITYTRVNESEATVCADFKTDFDERDDQWRYHSKPMPVEQGGVTHRLSIPDWSHTPGENCYTIKLQTDE